MPRILSTRKRKTGGSISNDEKLATDFATTVKLGKSEPSPDDIKKKFSI